MWKGYVLLAALIGVIAAATVYAGHTLESPSGKPKSYFADRLAEGIRTEYNAREQAKGEPFRAVKIVCAGGTDHLYQCRAITLSPAGVDCILLIVYAEGDKEFTVQAASTDPNCPEGHKT